MKLEYNILEDLTWMKFFTKCLQNKWVKQGLNHGPWDASHTMTKQVLNQLSHRRIIDYGIQSAFKALRDRKKIDEPLRRCEGLI
jgi:hypothetical protein